MRDDGIVLRPGTVEDVPALLRLMDIATQWLVKRGQTEQWGDGTVRHADNPARIKRAKEFAESGDTWVAVDTTSPTYKAADASEAEDHDLPIMNGVVGGLTVGGPNPYVQPATEPELYVLFLITDRASSGKGIGTLLLDKARELAGKAGVSLLRLDCYAGGSGGLVRYYESQGFERGETFEVKGWPGQILVQRLDQGNLKD